MAANTLSGFSGRRAVSPGALAGAPASFPTVRAATPYPKARGGTAAGAAAPYAAPKLPQTPVKPYTNPAAALGAQTSAAPTARVPVDYSNDPILAQVRLLGQQTVPDALAQADAARKQLLIAYGDPSLARSAVFGGKGFSLPGIAGGPDYTVADTSHTGDENTALAAQQNPFSTLGRLSHAHGLNQANVDNQMVDAGLYASGARVKALTEEERAYQQDQADAYASAVSALGQIDSGVGGAYRTEGQRQIDAETAAWIRAATAAADNPPATGPAGPGAPPVTPGQSLFRGNDPAIAVTLGGNLPAAVAPPRLTLPAARAKPAPKKKAAVKPLAYLGRH